MTESSSLIHTMKTIVETGGSTALAMAEGILLILILRTLKKAVPALLDLMKEEHAAHQAEVHQITTAHKEALYFVTKEHKEALLDLMDRQERLYHRLFSHLKNNRKS